MTITTRAAGESVNLTQVLNTKLEAPILQSEMGLNTQATATKQAVRWDEWSVKHNNDGTFKGIDQSEITLNSSATATKKPVRWDEFSVKHNNDGTFKTGAIESADIKDSTIINGDISSTAGIAASKLAIQKMFNKSIIANPSSTINAYGSQIDLTPVSGYTSIVPLECNLVFGGTFASETVTVSITTLFSDGTTLNITKTSTSAQTLSLTNIDRLGLIKDGVYITKLSFQSKSSIASTATTLQVNHYGFYL